MSDKRVFWIRVSALVIAAAMPLSEAAARTSVRVYASRRGAFTKAVGSIRGLRLTSTTSIGRFYQRGGHGLQERVVLAAKPGPVTMGVLDVMAVPISPGQSFSKSAAQLVGRTDLVIAGSPLRLLLFRADGIDMKISVGPKGTSRKSWTTYDTAFLGL